MKIHTRIFRNYFSSHVLRQYGKISAFIFLGLVVMVFLYWSQTRGVEIEQLPENQISAEAVVATNTPLRISIPKINVEAAFEEPLGVQRNWEVEVPEAFDTVGWYKHGPLPGELGPAVILGHVDSKAGPAVFYSLGELTPGDSLYITDTENITREFKVTELERHQQAGFPTEKVYGDIEHAGLRLITCTGTYDRGERRYSHNLIVFAELVE